MQENASPREGATLAGRYRIIGKIDRGGMSLIYEARDLRDDLDVIVKTASMPSLASEDPKDTRPIPERTGRREDGTDARFLQKEAVALATLRHPGIVRALGSGFHEGGYYLVLERLHGPIITMLPTILKVRRVPPPMAIAVICQVLEALEAVHQAGLVHRDVKPDNLILTAEGVKLIDFGLVELEAKPPENMHAMGTPSYMAPEQCMGSVIDRRADLYACGHLLHLMLAGRMAFPGASRLDAISVMSMQVNRAPESLDIAAPGVRIPSAVVEAVLKSLAKRPRDRFQTADEMRHALSAAVP